MAAVTSGPLIEAPGPKFKLGVKGECTPKPACLNWSLAFFFLMEKGLIKSADPELCLPPNMDSVDVVQESAF